MGFFVWPAYFLNYSRLGRVPQGERLELLELGFLQAGCPFWCLTNNGKVLKDCNIFSRSKSKVNFWWHPVMWSETVDLRTRPVWDQKNRSWSWSCTLWSWSCRSVMSCCETQSCRAYRRNDLEGHNNFSITVYSFSILCLEHHYCVDQQWRSLT